jgi:hypothetical protein
VPAVSPNGSGPANLVTIRAAVAAALKDAGYLHIPEGPEDPADSGCADLATELEQLALDPAVMRSSA